MNTIVTISCADFDSLYNCINKKIEGSHALSSFYWTSNDTENDYSNSRSCNRRKNDRSKSKNTRLKSRNITENTEFNNPGRPQSFSNNRLLGKHAHIYMLPPHTLVVWVSSSPYTYTE